MTESQQPGMRLVIMGDCHDVQLSTAFVAWRSDRQGGASMRKRRKQRMRPQAWGFMRVWNHRTVSPDGTQKQWREAA